MGQSWDLLPEDPGREEGLERKPVEEEMGNKGGEVGENKEQLRRAERLPEEGLKRETEGEQKPNRIGILNGRVEIEGCQINRRVGK